VKLFNWTWNQADNDATGMGGHMPEQEVRSAIERQSAREQRVRELEVDKQQRMLAIRKARDVIEGERALAAEAAQQMYNETVDVERARLDETFATVEERNQALTTYSQQRGADLASELRRLDAARDRDLAPLREQESKIEPEYQRLVAEVEASEQRALEQLSRRLMHDLNARVKPLAEQYLEARTKALAEGIGRVFFEFNRRALRELGEPLQQDLITTTFNELIARRSLIESSRRERLWANGVWAAFGSGARKINRALFQLVDDLEAAAEEEASSPEPDAWAQGIHAIRCGSATTSEFNQREAAFKAKWEAQRVREIVAKQPPPHPRPIEVSGPATLGRWSGPHTVVEAAEAERWSE
jgi:hypothetical protein